jgi:quercetin dioxygenase-like cupin family protein
MKPIISSAVSLLLLAALPAYASEASAAPAPADRQGASNQDAQTITIARNGTQPSNKGPAQYFTGTVRVDPLFQAREPSRTSGAYVTFEPGARSAWHTHPLGQVLIVTAGSGRIQRWGGPIEEIRPGDVVWIPPGQKHWHGASPTTAMTHIAIQEQVDGKNVHWMEQVTDEQYGK